MDDNFVPKGRVPLKSALEQLAEARQTNVPSAQAEIRTELHSGLMPAQAMERSTGRMFDIIPNSWATETALRWLESGECLLPNEKGQVRITPQRFDLFYGPEHAKIYVLERDLRRLINAKPKGATARERSVISEAEAQSRFDEWRKSCGDSVPSLAEDDSHMRQFGVSRKRVTDLRNRGGVKKRPRGRPQPK
jgi:hypothetical protein